MSKACKTIGELREQFRGIQTCAAETDAFIAKAMMWLCEKVEAGAFRATKKKRELSAYNKFVAERLREGMSLKEIAAEWKEYKAKTRGAQ